MKNATGHRAARLFSLVEVLTVIGILLVLAGILVPVLQRSRDRAAQVSCINNLRQLSLAIQMYYNKHREFPRGDLSAALAEFLPDSDQASFTCPTTLESYDAYYVAREHGDDDSYCIGCPRHQAINFAPGRGTQTFANAQVLHNGVAQPVGCEVGDGVLEFDDGSRVSINGMAKVLATFRMGDGTLYTILRIFGLYGTTILDVDVTPGSRFEVVTPAAIAGVAGTSFELLADYDAGEGAYSTEVSVQSGFVTVVGHQDQEEEGPVKLAPGQSVRKKAKPEKAQKDPKDKDKDKDKDK